MAGVADPAVVDVVAQDASGRILVVMVETRRWGAARKQASQLKQKISAYTAFITDGSLTRTYPEVAGQPVDIQLDCPEPPNGEFATIVEHAQAQLSPLGIGFRVNVTPKR